MPCLLILGDVPMFCGCQPLPVPRCAAMCDHAAARSATCCEASPAPLVRCLQRGVQRGRHTVIRQLASGSLRRVSSRCRGGRRRRRRGGSHAASPRSVTAPPRLTRRPAQHCCCLCIWRTFEASGSLCSGTPGGRPAPVLPPLQRVPLLRCKQQSVTVSLVQSLATAE